MSQIFLKNKSKETSEIKVRCGTMSGDLYFGNPKRQMMSK